MSFPFFMLQEIKTFPPDARLLFTILVTDSDFLEVIENLFTAHRIEYGIGIKSPENKVDIVVLRKDFAYAKTIITEGLNRYDRVTIKEYRALLYSNPN